jgi:hypothetical protein
MRRTPQQWLTLFQNQQDSDLSIKQFCLEHGISMSNFYRNKAAFKTQTSITASAAVSPFSQVYLAEPDQPSPLSAIQLNIGNVQLTLDSKTDVNWLVNLVGELA